jgi:ferric-dicitrate binding protein FerR (iron transport regulator)
VRIDQGSRARAISAAGIELSAGAVYVDTGGTSGRFEVRTPVATAHDIGTQFEVRLIQSALRLRVRSGIVELRHGTRLVSGRGGTEVTFTAAVAITRSMAPYGPEWDWVAGLAPPLEIEGLALAVFLERIAGEQGWQLRYADAALGNQARGITLHGSVNGLEPRQALDIALITSGLQYRLENGELTVFRGSRPAKPM